MSAWWALFGGGLGEIEERRHRRRDPGGSREYGAADDEEPCPGGFSALLFLRLP